jgi:uncharacterized protein YjbI with pentapeptide repeats
MTNAEQLELLNSGVEAWNKWREENPDIKINLFGADLSGADLYGADLSGADLSGADLSGARLSEADPNGADLSYANLSGADLSGADLRGADLDGVSLSGADLRRANLRGVNLSGVNLSGADLREADPNGADLRYANLSGADLSGVHLLGANLREADLSGANLREANLSGANLSGADLRGARLSEAYLREADLSYANLSGANLSNANLINVNFVETNVSDADISNSKIYGVNVWDLEGEFKEQNQLIITPDNASVITVDNIKVAQFVYLILNNKEVRDVLNTLTSKTVLILGRFALPERKVILDALRNKLREYDLLPIVFDFERPDDKDFTETIKTLAGMCYFVIADVTNPKSSPLELQATVPDYQIPFVPIIQEGESPFAMMVDLQKKYDWVLDTISYRDGDQLIRILKKGIIDRAMQKHDELRLIKAQMPTVISASQFEE